MKKLVGIVFCFILSFSVSVASASLIAGQEYYYYDPAQSPEWDVDSAQAKPIGVGIVAEGGIMINIRLLYEADEPTDMYFAVGMPDSGLYFFGPDHSFSANWIPLKSISAGELMKVDIVRDMPITLLPAGTYHFYAVAVPLGGDFSKYRIWETLIVIPDTSALRQEALQYLRDYNQTQNILTGAVSVVKWGNPLPIPVEIGPSALSNMQTFITAGEWIRECTGVQISTVATDIETNWLFPKAGVVSVISGSCDQDFIGQERNLKGPGSGAEWSTIHSAAIKIEESVLAMQNKDLLFSLFVHELGWHGLGMETHINNGSISDHFIPAVQSISNVQALALHMLYHEIEAGDSVPSQ